LTNSVICDKIDNFDIGLVPLSIVLFMDLFRLRRGMSVFEPYSVDYVCCVICVKFWKIVNFLSFYWRL